VGSVVLDYSFGNHSETFLEAKKTYRTNRLFDVNY